MAKEIKPKEEEIELRKWAYNSIPKIDNGECPPNLSLYDYINLQAQHLYDWVITGELKH